MKKAILIILSAIVLLLVGVFVLAMVTANSLVASFKPEIERIAGEALGVKAQISEIDVSVVPSTYFMLRGLTLSDNEHSDETFSLKEVRLDVRLWDLLSKKLSISSLSVISPDILAIKGPEGIRIAGLPSGSASKGKKAARERKQKEEPSAQTSPSESPISVALEEIRIENATLRLNDTVAKNEKKFDRVNLRAAVSLSGKEIVIPNFDLSLRALESVEFSATGQDITMKGDVLDAKAIDISLLGNRFALSGRFNLADKSGEARVDTTGVKIESLLPLAAFGPPDAKKTVDNFRPAGSFGLRAQGNFGPGTYESDGTLALSDISAHVGTMVVSALSGDLASNATHEKAEVSTTNLTLKLNDQPIAVQLKGTFKAPVASIESLKLNLFSGTADISGDLRLEDKQPLRATFGLKGINVSQALLAIGQRPDQQAFSALVDEVDGMASFPLKGVLPQDATANAKVSLSKAELKGFNLAGAVLRAVKGLPFLSGDLYESVPPEQRGDVDGPNTAISKLTASITVSGGKIKTPDLRAQSALFNLEADGTIGFDSSMDLNATLLFNPKFSESLVKRSKGLKGLLDSEGRLVVPLAIKGTAPKLIVLPNIERLLKTGAGKALEEKASEFLGKALGAGNKEGGKKGLGGMFGF